MITFTKTTMKRRVNGYTFEFNKDADFYECRGEMCWDDEHDEIPEPGLWSAALELCSDLRQEIGGDWNVEHSEKGWVEVQLR